MPFSSFSVPSPHGSDPDRQYRTSFPQAGKSANAYMPPPRRRFHRPLHSDPPKQKSSGPKSCSFEALKKHPQKGAACQGFVLSAGTGSQRTALTIASVTGASGAPEEGLLKVELGDGIMLIPHHLKHRVYPHTRTIPVTDPECRFPIILYRNKGTDTPAADLFYRKMCKAFRT